METKDEKIIKKIRDRIKKLKAKKKKPVKKRVVKRKKTEPLQRQTQKQEVNILFGDGVEIRKKRKRRSQQKRQVQKQMIPQYIPVQMPVSVMSNELYSLQNTFNDFQSRIGALDRRIQTGFTTRNESLRELSNQREELQKRLNEVRQARELPPVPVFEPEEEKEEQKFEPIFQPKIEMQKLDIPKPLKAPEKEPIFDPVPVFEPDIAPIQRIETSAAEEEEETVRQPDPRRIEQLKKSDDQPIPKIGKFNEKFNMLSSSNKELFFQEYPEFFNKVKRTPTLNSDNYINASGKSGIMAATRKNADARLNELITNQEMFS